MAEDGKVIFKYVGDTTGIDQANAEVHGKVSNLGATLGKLAIGAAIGKALVATVKYGSEFETAFTGVQKTVEATAEEFAYLRAGILDLSTELPFTAVEIASVAEAAGRLQIAVPNILEFTQVMLDLGVSTNLTADEAAMAMGKFANITQMPEENFRNLGSAIVDLGNNYETTEADILAMAVRLAGAGHQANMSEADIVGLAAGLSSLAIESEAGGSAFSRLITRINVAVETGSDALEQYADVAGMSADQFKKAFQEDAAGALTSFIEGLGALEADGKSAIVVLDEMGLTEIRLRDAILRSVGAGDQLTQSIKDSNEAWAENVALGEEAGKFYNTVEAQFQVLKNQVTEIAVGLYDEMRPALVETMQALREMFDTMKESGALEALGESLGNLASTLGGTLIALLPTFVDLINTLLPPLLQLVDAVLPVITALLEELTPIIAMLAETLFPILVDIAIALLEPFGELARAILPIIKDALERLMPFIQQIAEVILPLLASWMEALIPFYTKLVEAILPVIVSLLEKLLPPLIEIAEAILPVLISFAEALLPPLLELIESILPPLMDLFNALIDPLLEMVQTILPPLLSMFETLSPILSAIMELLAPLIELVAILASKLLDQLMPVIQTVAEVITTYLGGALEAIGPLVELLIGIFENLIEFINAVFKGDWEAAWTAIVDLFKGIINLVPTAVEAAINGAIALINALIAGVNSITEKIGIPAIPTIGNITLPRLKMGLDFVPYDKYLAYLDAGEKVLTAEDARTYRSLEATGALSMSNTPGTSSLTNSQSIGQINVYPDSDNWARIMALLEQVNKSRQVDRAGGNNGYNI